eukprot:CAMPEP_0203958814 /NCGR_PEP_ID=MMETSP0359-20131031/90119_1 /ASSEMBLY_ACC=CAM_ASM_000338 /TAXON_ID=268821 /ORGANISM="Scrippsiella Hangoei, Strain SHTV-5" /LENGTH=52 /DNA_ID=CAMNT_0050892813 /DNA_START=69 /DNA_END=224 /DNA_ORIENTATION=+
MAHRDSMSDLGVLLKPVEGTLPGASSVQYSCQTFAQSTVVGPDGRPQTERFA